MADVPHFIAELENVAKDSVTDLSIPPEEFNHRINMLMALATVGLPEDDLKMLANALYVRAADFKEAASEAEIAEGVFREALKQLTEPDSV